MDKKQNGRLAMIAGVTGQDGSYLSELLVEKGYEVIGIGRRSSVDTTARLKGVIKSPQFKYIEGDITDPANVNSWFSYYRPDEFYNLAAMSHVATSFEQPHLTWRVDAEGVLNILEAIRHYRPDTRFYQASTSEQWGRNYSMETFGDDGYSTYTGNYNLDWTKPEKIFAPDDARPYQDEWTPFKPESPYAVAKLAAHNMVNLYRYSYGLHASAGIMMNHESERRGEQFVTRKITKWIGEFLNWYQLIFESGQLVEQDWDNNIYLSLCDKTGFPKLRLGNLKAKRDWGHAEDYVYAMWLMLQQETPDDYVISTGETHSVEDFLFSAQQAAGLSDWKDWVVQDMRFMRPSEVDYLRGDSSKAKEKLGWQPKVSFQELVTRMVNYDRQNAELSNRLH